MSLFKEVAVDVSAKERAITDLVEAVEISADFVDEFNTLVENIGEPLACAVLAKARGDKLRSKREYMQTNWGRK